MTQQTTRDLALARRKALSSSGKGANTSSTPDRIRTKSMQRRARPTEGGAKDSAVRAQAGGQRAGRSVAETPVSSAARKDTAAMNPTRGAALARRKAMSNQGKAADLSTDRTRTGGGRKKPFVENVGEDKEKGDCGCGCNGAGDCNDTEAAVSKPRRPANKRGLSKIRANKVNLAVTNPSKAASLARRQAQSTRGKAGINASGMTAAQIARAGNPSLSSRELAKALREQQSQRGGAGKKKSAPTGCVRPKRENAQGSAQGAATDAPWKVGVSETTHGQAVTGTMVGRSPDVTGDEASTCRSVTGTEYMGADVFRDFCQAEPVASFRDSGLSKTGRGNSVTGNEVGRSSSVTGDEQGTCKNVTGTEYVDAAQSEKFCGSKAGKPPLTPGKITSAETRAGKSVTGNNVGRSGKVTGDEVGADRSLTGTQYMQTAVSDEIKKMPAKVGASATLRGGSVTGTMVGRHPNMTGDEPGSCRGVTGDDYVGQEQYDGFCDHKPAPADNKVGVSVTLSGERVTGTMTGRSGQVTGDEPGTCKAITGTPYAGAEQSSAFCNSGQAASLAARTQPSKRMYGAAMTGIQPAVGGKMTGDEKGACEAVSGTPYVGADQVAAACPATAAEVGSPDFPQPLSSAQPWTQFSVGGPAHASEAPQKVSGVTGASYEGGSITGPFGMADGKVTGTEQMRFGQNSPERSKVVEPAASMQAEEINGRAKTRVTGEGIDSGLTITGDDWDLGDRVSGTEGVPAQTRNPSLQGPAMSMAAALAHGRPEAVPQPVSHVTGSSGNTKNGSLVTYSGGARG